MEVDPLIQDLTLQDFFQASREVSKQKISRPSLSYWKDAWLRLQRNRQAITSLGIIAGLTVFTLAGPLAWRLDPAFQDLTRISEPPTFAKSVLVLGEPEPFQELVSSEVPATPQLDAAATLKAPGLLQITGNPTTQSVRLQWSPSEGASGYVVYRSEEGPPGEDYLGVPIAEIEGGNRLSYEDRFNLEARRYHYAVTAKNGAESAGFSAIETTLAPAIRVADARKLTPDAEPGTRMTLPAHPLGTDYLGRDLLARLMEGARVSLFIGFVAPLLAMMIGILIGGVSGFAGGKVDHWLMRMTDFVLALPFLLFMILFKVAFGAGAGESGISAMLLAMVILSWTGSARLVRGQVLQLRDSEFVQASRLLGASWVYLLLRHLLPNTMGVILVSLTFAIPSAIFTEAFLSFIGMGVAPPTPSWGSMCNDGIQTFLTHPHEFLFPALFISMAVLAFNLLGDGLRDALDPKMRSVQ